MRKLSNPACKPPKPATPPPTAQQRQRACWQGIGFAILGSAVTAGEVTLIVLAAPELAAGASAAIAEDGVLGLMDVGHAAAGLGIALMTPPLVAGLGVKQAIANCGNP